MAQPAPETENKSDEVEPFSNGLQIVVLTKGDGKTYPKKNDNVSVRYKGFFHGGLKHGFEFDSSWDSPYQFKVGEEIKGWNKGIKRMSLGERSILKSYSFLSIHCPFNHMSQCGLLLHDQYRTDWRTESRAVSPTLPSAKIFSTK